MFNYPSTKFFRTLNIFLLLFLHVFAEGQQSKTDSLVGQRIIMLTGRGEINFLDEKGKILVKQAPNIVASVSRVDGTKVWILSPGEIEPGGWVSKSNIILLSNALRYFTSIIEANPNNWDAYFRKAEAEHALNKRDDAISDYTTSISLHANDAYLYFRRARCYQARQMCTSAIADYDTAIRMNPNSEMAADGYGRQAKLYADCSDSLQRNPQKAIEAAHKAIELDSAHPTYLTILASAYASDGQFEKVIGAQKKALASPNFPPGYREEATKYLQQLEQKLLSKKAKHD